MPVCPSRYILYMLDPSLDADLARHGMNLRRIEGGSQPDGFRILSYALVYDAVEGLAPPLIGGNVEPRHCRGIVLHFRGFLGKGHPAHQVGSPLFCCQMGVQIRRRRGSSGERRLHGAGQEKQSRYKPLRHLGHV